MGGRKKRSKGMKDRGKKTGREDGSRYWEGNQGGREREWRVGR